MKNFLHFWLGPIIAVSVIIVQLPLVEKQLTHISKRSPGQNNLLKILRETVPLAEEDESDTESAFAYWIIAAILIFGTGYNYWLTIISPYRVHLEQKKKRWDEIDKRAKQIVLDFRDAGFDVSLNMMIPSRKLFSRSEPRGVTFFPKVFEVVWGYGTHKHVNSHLKFTTNQGACGMAYRREDFFSVDLQKKKEENKNVKTEFNLTNKQLELTSDITMVICCPILLIKRTVERQKTKIVGVVNLECRMDGVGELIADPEIQSIVYVSMMDLADMYISF